MSTRFRINLLVAGFILIICIVSSVSAASLVLSWREQPSGDAAFSNLMISRDGSMVFAGGDQVFVRSWDGDTRWGGMSGAVASMSTDGNYFVSAINDNVRKINRTGSEIWNRITGSPFTAVAVSGDGSLVVAADNRGFLRSWKADGKNLGVNNDTGKVNRIEISPSQDLVVVSSEEGPKVFSPAMKLIWENDTFGNLDSFLAFSADSSTLFFSGDNRVLSYTATGSPNWEKEITRDAIADMACSDDCASIVLGSKDGNVWVLNKEGQVRWKYSAGSWVNAVGVSRDGSVIVAGTLDRNIYTLDKDGELLATTKTNTVIQQQSVAVSGDGKRIVVTDEHTMYGFELRGIPEGTPTVTSPPTLITTPVTVKTTTIPTTTSSPTTTNIPVTTGTPQSPPGPCLAIVAIAAGAMFLGMKRRT